MVDPIDGVLSDTHEHLYIGVYPKSTGPYRIGVYPACTFQTSTPIEDLLAPCPDSTWGAVAAGAAACAGCAEAFVVVLILTVSNLAEE